MANAASRGKSNKGGKISPFKKQGGGAAKTVTPKAGGNKAQLDNIKQLAGIKGSPKKAPTMTPKPKGNKAQMDNLRKWGGSKGGGGDNPYGGGK